MSHRRVTAKLIGSLSSFPLGGNLRSHGQREVVSVLGLFQHGGYFWRWVCLLSARESVHFVFPLLSSLFRPLSFVSVLLPLGASVCLCLIKESDPEHNLSSVWRISPLRLCCLESLFTLSSTLPPKTSQRCFSSASFLWSACQMKKMCLKMNCVLIASNQSQSDFSACPRVTALCRNTVTSWSPFCFVAYEDQQMQLNLQRDCLKNCVIITVLKESKLVSRLRVCVLEKLKHLQYIVCSLSWHSFTLYSFTLYYIFKHHILDCKSLCCVCFRYCTLCTVCCQIVSKIKSRKRYIASVIPSLGCGFTDRGPYKMNS